MALTSKKSDLALMHIFVVFFGVGAWVAINGVWVELPILVDQLPEGWNLPSFLVILMQAANIGPLTVAIMQGFCAKYYHQNVLIHIILITGTLACFFLIFFWNWTVYINGSLHSVALFTLFLIVGFVDCTSTITFMPSMTKFQAIFITTYFIGEGLSGFLPSVFSLIQGVAMGHCSNESFVNVTTNETQYSIVTRYEEPRFSVEVFFGLLTLMMAGCFTAYLMLNHLNLAKSFLQDSTKDSLEKDGASTSANASNPDEDDPNATNDNEKNVSTPAPQQLNLGNYVYLYLMVFWISGMSNGVMPSVISYSSLPYGQLPYHFAVTLGAMANPVACFIAMFLPAKSFIIVGMFATFATGFASFLMLLAVKSPCPILVGTDGGAAIMVLSQIAFVFTTSYVKVSIGQILRERGYKKSLVWYGAFTQLGSLTGACTVFPLVNVYHVFTSGDQCTTVC